MLIDIRKDHDERIRAAQEANEEARAEAEVVNASRVPARKNAAKITPRLIPVPRPFGPATAQRVRATLRSALNAALRAGDVSRNVAALAEVARTTRPRVKVWEPEQLGEFLDAISADDERLYPMLAPRRVSPA
jgi:hypothetical protein